MPQVSSIERDLTKEQYAEFKSLIENKDLTIDELVDEFEKRGFTFSSSAVGRQKLKIERAALGFEKSRLAMEMFIEKVGPDVSSSEQGEMLVNTLRTLTFDCMVTQMEEGEDINPKTLETLAKVVKNAASASRLDQDYADKERKRIQQEEREKAADTFEKVATENGISKDTAEQIRNQILGVQ